VEPILIETRSPPDAEPALSLRHIVFRCTNGYGLSAITEMPSMGEDSNSDFGNYEVVLISHVSDDGWSYLIEDFSPRGCLTVHDIGVLRDEIEQHGSQGFLQV